MFAPDQAITREQFAAILYRCAEYKGLDVTAGAGLSRATPTPPPWENTLRTPCPGPCEQIPVDTGFHLLRSMEKLAIMLLRNNCEDQF